MNNEDLAAAVRVVEKDVGLSNRFLGKLLADPDPWSFVIKAHVLLETALTDLLSGYLLHQKLQIPVIRLPLNGRTGKVAFLRAMGLLGSREETFLNEFSALRNDLAHTIHNVRFDYQTFLATNGNSAKRLGVAAAAWGRTDAVRRDYQAQFRRNPQNVLWLVTMGIVAKSRALLSTSKRARSRIQRSLQKLYRLLPPSEP